MGILTVASAGVAVLAIVALVIEVADWIIAGR
jgi:hypothetical protein